MGRNRPWPTLAYYSRICLEGVKRALSHGSRSSGRILNPEPLIYKDKVPPIRPRPSIQSAKFTLLYA
jgi:hypothetical protein